MSVLKVAVLVGSLRRQSFNRRLADGLIELAPDNLQFEHIEIRGLPPYDQDQDAQPPEPVERLKAQIKACDGVLFVTPEYNRSVPGVLKNAIDHASRPYGQSVWAGKPAGIAGVSIGAAGTSMAQQHLRNILAYLDMPTLGQPEVFIQMKDGLFLDDGSIGPGSRTFLEGWMRKFAAWVKLHAHAG